jgi:predicted MFS family arabinose efflux permease
MSQSINRNRLFIGSCFALITTAMAFAIRAGIMNDLAGGFSMSDSQLGWIQFMGTFGFPIATLVGGPLYNSLGPKNLGFIAFFCHIAGITFSIFSTSFMPLFISTFLISFANGMVEAAFNPMITTMFDAKDTTKMLNRFHVWFPGGIVIGALLAILFTKMGLSWQYKIALMYIPAIIYGFLFWGQTFPEKSTTLSSSNSENFKAILTSPLYLFLLVCMAMTATTELGTQSWVERILGQAGANPLLILAMVTGLMALGRFFGGEIVHRLNITGVLLASAIITTIGIVLMSQATGGMVYVSAILFAIGVCYFWPNMISFVAVYLPKTGAFGMSLIGGVGMVGLSIFQPIIGGWIQSSKIESANASGYPIASSLSGEDLKKAFDAIPKEAMDKIELTAGQATLDNIAVIPAILIVAFGILYFMMRKREATHA